MLSAGSAIWWLGLLKYPPDQIFAATPRRVRDIGAIVIQRERRLARIWHNGLPVTTPSQAILDFAATGPDASAHSLFHPIRVTRRRLSCLRFLSARR
jgi:hypothetical protein